jgi:hypothetical protein
MLIDWGVAFLAALNVNLMMASTAHVAALAFLYGIEGPDLKYIYKQNQSRPTKVKVSNWWLGVLRYC